MADIFADRILLYQIILFKPETWVELEHVLKEDIGEIVWKTGKAYVIKPDLIEFNLVRK